jgi:hypothetical protein
MVWKDGKVSRYQVAAAEPRRVIDRVNGKVTAVVAEQAGNSQSPQ